MPNTEIEKLFEHLRWADEQLGEVLSSSTSPRAIEIFAHVVGTELVWLDRILGREQTVPVWPEPTLEKCGELRALSRTRWDEYLGSLELDRLDDPIRYTNSAGREFTSSLRDILIHVALHGAYHRGQVALLIRDAGSQPAPTDYIALVRGAPAATRDDAR